MDSTGFHRQGNPCLQKVCLLQYLNGKRLRDKSLVTFFFNFYLWFKLLRTKKKGNSLNTAILTIRL